LCDIPQLPLGTAVYMHHELLNKKYREYSNHYYFGDLSSIYGRTVSSPDNVDCLTLEVGNEKIFLKRFYG
jgi:hypothetical protein